MENIMECKNIFVGMSNWKQTGSRPFQFNTKEKNKKNSMEA